MDHYKKGQKWDFRSFLRLLKLHDLDLFLIYLFIFCILLFLLFVSSAIITTNTHAPPLPNPFRQNQKHEPPTQFIYLYRLFVCLLD